MEINEIKNSGLLELYVSGALNPTENQWVAIALEKHPELQVELRAIENVYEQIAMASAVQIDPTIKPIFLASVNYQERIANGEQPTSPPLLNSKSTQHDFEPWLSRPDLQEPAEYDSMHGYIIGHDTSRTTMIVWLKQGAPPEVHTDEIEKFLILEGTCDITIGDQVHSMKAGDSMEIPLHISHHLQVTSDFRCKVILERAAA